MKQILVVDDEKDILKSLKRLLEKNSFGVTTVSSGKRALAALQKQNFDLVILDALMPDMSGIEVALSIRKDKKFKNMKLCFFSVLHLSDSSTKELKQIKPDGLFQKPVSAKILISGINKILSK
jgi:two-component system, sensor histidine kinase and response regulator